jgi:hypothetical protein
MNVTLSAPLASLSSVDFATGDGTALAGSDYVATAGTVDFAPGETTRTVLVKTIDDGLDDEGNENFSVNLLNPSPGTSIADGQGLATILDPTKFYVVNDATMNQTFEYNSVGGLVESYNLNSGNAAPRGAASTAAGG